MVRRDRPRRTGPRDPAPGAEGSSSRATDGGAVEGVLHPGVAKLGRLTETGDPRPEMPRSYLQQPDGAQPRAPEMRMHGAPGIDLQDVIPPIETLEVGVTGDHHVGGLALQPLPTQDVDRF